MKALYTHLENIEQLKNLAEENIDRLKDVIMESKEELKMWQGLLKLAQTCAGIADEEAGKAKKDQLRYKWAKVSIQGAQVWASEAGNVNLKAWGKFQGFPKGLEHLRPFADGDRSANHMAHRPKKDHFDSGATDFDILIDCQLAVEKAHDEWEKKQKKEKV